MADTTDTWRDAPPHVGPNGRNGDPNGTSSRYNDSHARDRERSPPPRERERDAQDRRGGADMYASRREFQRGRQGDGSGEERRGSPEYAAYAQGRNGNGDANGNGNGEGGWRRGGGGGGGGGDYLENRRRQRDMSTVTIWPPSPRTPERSPTPDRKHRKRRRSPTPDSAADSDDDDSEDDRRRKARKSRSGARHKHASHRSSRKEKGSERRRGREETESEDDSEEERRRRRRKERERERERDRDRGRGRDRSAEVEGEGRMSLRRDSEPEDSGQWVEKPSSPGGSAIPAAPADVPPPSAALVSPPQTRAAAPADPELDSEPDVGPQPLFHAQDKVHERDYGGALLRGEGSAMAAFVQSNERIPRRGEIGLTSTEIDVYEQAGYVMSGSRHKRMNAVRMRKENQVISAEEKRSLLKMQREEKEKRESLIVGGFKEMLEERLSGKPGIGPAPPPPAA